MRYYRYDPDANVFEGVVFSEEYDHEISMIHSQTAPLKKKWRTPACSVFEDEPLNPGDFPSLSNYNVIPVMTQRAWEELQPLIGYCCEALPIIHPSGIPHFVVHVMDIIDCLDETRSEVRRSQVDGRINRIFKYAFKPEFLNDKHIFELPPKSGGELIVDDVFRRAVEDSNLSGLRFQQLPMSE